MKNGAWFPYFLIALLLVSVGSNIYLIVRANSDPNFAVEPDYYAKAVDWDASQAARADSEALGWRVAVEATRTGLAVEIRDALGRPVQGADVRLEAFPNAFARERMHAELVEDDRGRYVLRRPFPRSGIWEYRLAAVRGDDTFLHVAREELP
ncbi:MAG: FixH family protein [Myxococcota bacterium]